MVPYWYLGNIFQIWLKSCLKLLVLERVALSPKTFLSFYHYYQYMYIIYTYDWCLNVNAPCMCCVSQKNFHLCCVVRFFARWDKASYFFHSIFVSPAMPPQQTPGGTKSLLSSGVRVCVWRRLTGWTTLWDHIGRLPHFCSWYDLPTRSRNFGATTFAYELRKSIRRKSFWSPVLGRDQSVFFSFGIGEIVCHFF